MADAKADAKASGINIDDVKKGLQTILPIIEVIAKRTPNKYDDAAVAFLKLFLDNPAAAAVLAAG